jgi:hypothetical protein
VFLSLAVIRRHVPRSSIIPAGQERPAAQH